MSQLKRNLNLLIASSTLVLLTGCSTLSNLYDAYFMAGYDTNEYSLITKIRTHADLHVGMCNDQVVSKNTFDYLHYKSIEFKNFSQYIPKNDNAYKLSEQIVELTKQGKDMYSKNDSVSAGFCKLKLQQISRSAENIQKVIGSKTR